MRYAKLLQLLCDRIGNDVKVLRYALQQDDVSPKIIEALLTSIECAVENPKSILPDDEKS
jgi:hypothetical protein